MSYCQSYIEILLCATCVCELSLRVQYLCWLIAKENPIGRRYDLWIKWSTVNYYIASKRYSSKLGTLDKSNRYSSRLATLLGYVFITCLSMICFLFAFALFCLFFFLLAIYKIKSTDILIPWINFSKQEIQFILCLALLYPQLQSIIWLIPPVLN